jgi:hypothetical protein
VDTGDASEEAKNLWRICQMPTLESNPRENRSPSERVFTSFIAGTERMTAAHFFKFFRGTD